LKGTGFLVLLTSFHFFYGMVTTAFGMIILPAEVEHLFPGNESLWLGMLLLIVGLSQGVSPFAGHWSDTSKSSFGRRSLRITSL
jgi:hypothetical protein